MAQEIHRRGLATLAIFLLEAHKPVTFLYSQAVHAVAPAAAVFAALVPVLRPQNLDLLGRVLEREETVERLIRRLEDLARG